jgi:hypothetical protein
MVQVVLFIRRFSTPRGLYFSLVIFVEYMRFAIISRVTVETVTYLSIGGFFCVEAYNFHCARMHSFTVFDTNAKGLIHN